MPSQTVTAALGDLYRYVLRQCHIIQHDRQGIVLQVNHEMVAGAPMKALLDRMVYAFNMYYGETRGPSLWAGKSVAILSTCGYPPEKGADLLEEGIRRYCKHSKLNYLGMLCEHHTGYKSVFLSDDKIVRVRAFADMLFKNL